jgi:hypothetical protein
MQILCSLKSAIFAGLKKIAEPLQHNVKKRAKLKNAASRLHGCWHNNSQRVLLTPPSGGRPYHNRIARGIQIPRIFGYPTYCIYLCKQL